MAAKALAAYGAACRKIYAKLTPEADALALAARAPRSYVISGGSQAELHAVFEDHGIAAHFAAILGSPTKKAEHLGRVLEESGCEAREVLFVGDGWTDFKTSKQFGCHFVFLAEMSDWHRVEEQMVGYDRVTRCATWGDVMGRVGGRGASVDAVRPSAL